MEHQGSHAAAAAAASLSAVYSPSCLSVYHERVFFFFPSPFSPTSVSTTRASCSSRVFPSPSVVRFVSQQRDERGVSLHFRLLLGPRMSDGPASDGCTSSVRGGAGPPSQAGRPGHCQLWVTGRDVSGEQTVIIPDENPCYPDGYN